MMKRIIAICICALIILSTMTGCDRGGEQPADTTPAQLTDALTDPPAETTTEATLETTTAAPVLEEGLIYQAHRGLSTEYPENTMPAFTAAIDAGYRIIELDPAFTSDGRCILMHDKTINRTCRNQDGNSLGEDGIPVSSLTYAQLQTYDAGVFKDDRFKGTRVPLLSEVAQLVKGTGVSLKVDNKVWKYSAAELEIIFMIAEQYPTEVGITCKDLDAVARVVDRLPNAIIHYDGTVNEKVCKSLREMVGDRELYIWFPISGANERMCNTIKKYGYLGLWTVKSEAELQKAEELGADIIETNGEVKP